MGHKGRRTRPEAIENGDEGRRGETAVYREWSGSEKKRGEREVPLQLHDSTTMDDEESRSQASGPSDPG